MEPLIFYGTNSLSCVKRIEGKDSSYRGLDEGGPRARLRALETASHVLFAKKKNPVNTFVPTLYLSYPASKPGR